jgi:hypothetical protein
VNERERLGRTAYETWAASHGILRAWESLHPDLSAIWLAVADAVRDALAEPPTRPDRPFQARGTPSPFAAVKEILDGAKK